MMSSISRMLNTLLSVCALVLLVSVVLLINLSHRDNLRYLYTVGLLKPHTLANSLTFIFPAA